MPRSLPCKYDSIANAIIDDTVKPGRILGRLLTFAEASFAEFFFSTALVFCHPSNSGDWTEGLVELANAYIVNVFKSNGLLSPVLVAHLSELLDNALQLKKLYVAKLAAKTYRTLLYLSDDKIVGNVVNGIVQALGTINEPIRLYSRLELLTNIMRNLVERNIEGLDDIMRQVVGLLDINDAIKTSLAMDCLLAYVFLVNPIKLESFLVTVLENAFEYLSLVSDGEDNLNSTGPHSLLHPLITTGLDRLGSKGFIVDLIHEKLQNDHLKSKSLARLMKVCVHKIDADYRKSLIAKAAKEMEKFDGLGNVKEASLKRLEYLFTLISHSMKRYTDILSCQREFVDLVQRSSAQLSPMIGFLMMQCLKEIFSLIFSLKYHSDIKSSLALPEEAEPKLESVPQKHADEMVVFLNSLQVDTKTKTQLTVWRGIVQGWLIVGSYCKVCEYTFEGQLSGLKEAIKFNPQDSAEVLETKMGIISDLFTFRYMSMLEMNGPMYGLRLFAESFTRYPMDLCLPPQVHCRQLELISITRLFYLSIEDICISEAAPYLLCGYEFVSRFAAGMCGTLLHYIPSKYSYKVGTCIKQAMQTTLSEDGVRGLLRLLDRTELLKRIFYYCGESDVAQMLQGILNLDIKDYENDMNAFINICRNFLDGRRAFDRKPSTELKMVVGEKSITRTFASMCLSWSFAEQNPMQYIKLFSDNLVEESMGMNLLALDFINKSGIQKLSVDDNIIKRIFELRCNRNEDESKFELRFALFYQKITNLEFLVPFKPQKKSERIALLEVFATHAPDKVIDLVEDLGYDGLEASTTAMNFINKFCQASRLIIADAIQLKLLSNNSSEQKKVILVSCLYALSLPHFETSPIREDLVKSLLTKNHIESEVMQNAIGMLMSISACEPSELPIKLLLPVLCFKSTFSRKMGCYELLEDSLVGLIGGCLSSDEQTSQKCRLILDYLCTRIVSKDTFAKLCERLLDLVDTLSAQQKKIALIGIRKLVRRNYILLNSLMQLKEKMTETCLKLLKGNESAVIEEAFELLSTIAFFNFPTERPKTNEPLQALAYIQAADYRFPDWYHSQINL